MHPRNHRNSWISLKSALLNTKFGLLQLGFWFCLVRLSPTLFGYKPESEHFCSVTVGPSLHRKSVSVHNNDKHSEAEPRCQAVKCSGWFQWAVWILIVPSAFIFSSNQVWLTWGVVKKRSYCLSVSFFFVLLNLVMFYHSQISANSVGLRLSEAHKNGTSCMWWCTSAQTVVMHLWWNSYEL